MRYLLLLLLFAPALAGATYDIGPGQTYTSIGAFPWENLAAGDIVQIHWRSTPYAEKFVISAQGTSGSPIIVRGIPDATSGALPIITGENATTRTQLDYWGDNRGVIKIGGASTPSGSTPQYVTIEYLDVRSAHANYTYTDDAGTAGVSYAANAAAIYVEQAKHIRIRYCEIHDSGNGLFIGPGGGVGGSGNPNLTEDCYVGYNYIYDNGNSGSAFEHNSYCESAGITYEYNHYGPTKSGANGNNLKDRSSTCVVRYNWIEAGNRQLDLVEADGSGIETLSGYDTTFVYGNILIEPNGAGNSQIIHYGGDNGTTSTYRKGTLYLYNNTIYSTRTGNTTLVRLSTNSETCDCRNNIIFVTANASNLGLIDDTGVLNYRNCFFKGTPTPSHSGAGMQGTVNNQGGNVTGGDPGWTNVGSQDFTLTSTAASRDQGTTLASGASAHPLTYEYLKHQQQNARPSDGTLDIGALEYDNGGAPTAPAAPSSCTATAQSGLQITVQWSDNSGNEDGFKLERDDGTGFVQIQTLGVNVTSFVDTGLTDGQQYTYRVRAYNTVGDSAYSNTASATAAVTVGSGGGGSGGGGGGGGGCTAGLGSAWWLALMVPLAVLSATRKQRKSPQP
ncbi:MAG: fibronectin type III domain-containing protein [Planctomycetes bacterium]|nr:fibronectin type III domain-containing protein [Planctomycetota bacterium]